jgi:hypothetical protein
LIFFEIHINGEVERRIDVSKHYFQCVRAAGWAERAILREQATKMLLSLMKESVMYAYKGEPNVATFIVFQSKADPGKYTADDVLDLSENNCPTLKTITT